MIKINKGEQDTPLKHKGADKMKDFLLTQVMPEQQVKYAMDNNHAVIGHTIKCDNPYSRVCGGEHVTVARQWRLKAGVFTNHVTVAIGGRRPKKSPLQLVHPQSDGKLTDGTISRLHFVLDWLPIEDEVTIKDLSNNGTFVNGHKLKTYDSHSTTREHLLKDGDEILVGETRLLFEEIE